MGVFDRKYRLRWEIAATLLVKLVAIILISRVLFGPDTKLDPEPSIVGSHLFSPAPQMTFPPREPISGENP